MKKLLVYLCLLLLSIDLWAQPYLPSQESVVVAQVPTLRSDQALQSLLRLHRAHPENQAVASDLVNAYIQLARSEQDVRYFGYAEGIIRKYRQISNADLLLHWADVLQQKHQFTDALGALDAALAADEGLFRARLMRAHLYFTQGNYEKSLQDCQALIGKVDELISVACITQVRGYTGKLLDSYSLLQSTFTRASQVSADEKRWVLMILIEMATRIGKIREATQHWDRLKDNGSINAHDAILYSDYLLQCGHLDMASEVLNELDSKPSIILRRSAFFTSENQRSPAMKQALWTRENGHLREQIINALYVEKDYPSAVTLAVQNWRSNKESTDYRLLVQAAVKSNRPMVLQDIQQWLMSSKYEDACGKDQKVN